MAPKKPSEKLEARQPLTAILLADSFTQRFRPMTVERPKVLLPLVNVPMIEYTLEWLALNRVEEAFVFCCAHADQIKKYLAESKWAQSTSGMKVTTIVSTNCLSMGEAMRLIDQKDIIKSDFVLVSGDTVSNMELSTVVEAHKQRREKDKSAILTMVMKQVSHPSHRLRLGDTDLMLTLDSETKRLLKYQEVSNAKSSTVHKVDASFFSERDCVQVRCDLMDTHICICAPEVLMMFSDNFDYQNLRRDFVAGVLSEEELGNKLYLHIISQEYAARVHNLRSYDAVSWDILQRWSFPFVPDTNVLYRGGPWGPSSYRYGGSHRYLEHNVTIARSAELGGDVAVGAGSSVGEGSVVERCVVGRGCRIGVRCRLQGCFLQDNVVIHDGAVLRSALVCERAVVKPGAIVDGAVLAYGVVIGPRHRVGGNMRLSLCQQVHQSTSLSDDELEYATSGGSSIPEPSPKAGQRRNALDASGLDSSSLGSSMEAPTAAAVRAAEALALGRSGAQVTFDEELVGPGGAGYRWVCTSDGPDGVDDYSIAPPRPRDGNESAAEDAVSTPRPGHDARAVESSGRADDAESESESEEEDTDPEVSFKREVADTFLRCAQMRFDQVNAVIELNGLKIAEDRSFADCARYIFTTLLGLCLPAPPRTKQDYRPLFPETNPLDAGVNEGRLVLLRTFKKHLTDWGALLQRFLRTEDDQVELLLTFEEYCGGEGVFEAAGEDGTPFSGIFTQVVQQLYDAEVLSEEALLAWADEKMHAEESERVYLNKASKFIDWLRTADEEEEAEDEEESDDDDE